MSNIRPLNSLAGDIARDDAGDTLIEVIIGAAILIVIVLGTLAGFQVATHQSVEQRQVVEAEALAQQSEDQLIAEPVGELQNFPREYSETVQGITYEVKQDLVYETLAGQSSCSKTNGGVTYAKITSRVTYPTSNANITYPAHSERFVALSLTGGLIVHVHNYDSSEPWTTANGSSDVQIEAISNTTGKTNFASTDTNGCAVLPSLAPGTYRLEVNNYEHYNAEHIATGESPLVTDTINSGTNTFASGHIVQSVTVAAGSTPTVASVIMAEKGSIAVSFEGNKEKALADSVMVENGTPSPAISIAFPNTPVTTTSATSPAAPPSYETITAGGLFPFSDVGKTETENRYSVYAGVCNKDAPSLFGSNKTPAVGVSPGLSTSTTVQVPPALVKVYSGTSGSTGQTPTGSTPVTTKIAVEDTGCGYWRGYSSANGTASTPKGANSLLATPYLPFGKYLACVSENVNTSGVSGTTTYYKSVEFENASTSGSEAKVYWGGATTTPTGACPT
jgi:Tfp pilus assembly protein PilV